ncbi:U2-ctenitoxin-Pn1b [Folsomia candida]|uniref:U2-ctenitoxin-Pn1b n=1 Tax=Folsomia candida TaxID=158441 RepID=A0A226DVM8_FOLCA|nr:U2-ctenitoxin-Pn1b [Folsomia candida]
MRVDSNSLALMATAGVILLISGHAAPKEVPYAGRCEPTDTCAGKDMTCRNGNCVCAKGYTGAYRCHEYTQIHRIITIEVILFYGSLCTRSILRILHRALWFL